MPDPKDKKKQHLEDADPSDEIGGGGDAFTEKDFFDALKKVSKKKDLEDKGDVAE